MLGMMGEAYKIAPGLIGEPNMLLIGLEIHYQLAK